MADQIVTNEVPSTATQWFCCYRLVETMLAAGWTITEMSDGTTVTTSDNWTGNFGSLGSNSWIILRGGVTNQQILFRRSATSDTNGWIIWSKGGNFTTGGTASAPANIPSDTKGSTGHNLRGAFSPGTPGTFGASASWFGSTSVPTRLNIGCRDAALNGDESWWILAKGAGNWDVATNGDHGTLAFESLSRASGTGIVDAFPYAWWCPRTDTANWAEGMDDLNILLDPEGSSAEGRWRRWWPGEGAEGTINTIAGSQLVDGETFILDDGANPAVTFEFDSDSSVTQSNTLRAVNFTQFDTATQIRDAIIAAIIAAPVLAMTARATDSAQLRVINTNEATGADGNNTITETVADAGFTVSGMSGGQDEDFVQYGSGGLFSADPSTPTLGEGPSWGNDGDRYRYQNDPPLVLHRIHLNKAISDGYRDPDGGWTTNILFSSTSNSSNLDTFLVGANPYAKFGSNLVVWWDDEEVPPVQ